MIYYFILILSLCSLSSSLEKLEAYVLKSKKLKTEAFVLIKDGVTISEHILQGQKKSKRLFWSMSKSVSSLLAGIAIDKKYISLDDRVCDTLKCSSKDLSLKHLLQMTSGLEWNEFYEASPFNSHIVHLLYQSSKYDASSFVLKQTFKYTPGEKFYYSSGDTTLLMSYLRHKLPTHLKDNFPWKWLFEPLGIDAVFERDKKGVFLGASYVYMNVDDLSKLGQLILAKGMWQGQRVISEKYLDFSFSLSPPLRIKCDNSHQMSYGAQFWLNKRCGEKKIKMLSDVSKDWIAMLGHGGQSMFINHDLKTIVIRISNDSTNKLDFNKYLSLVEKVVK